MSKEKVREAIQRTGLTHRDLARRAGVGESSFNNALIDRVSPEKAGDIARVLAEALDLSYAERRELFWELASFPEQNPEDRRGQLRREAIGDPMEQLKEDAGIKGINRLPRR